MPNFDYEASDSKGKLKRGMIEADSLRLARVKLREQHLIPLTLNPCKAKQQAAQLVNRQRLNRKSLSVFFRHLATLLAASLPLAEALASIAAQTVNKAQQRLFIQLKQHVNEGLSFAQALRLYPNAFGQLYCAAIHAGEQTGKLATILDFLADYSEKQYKINQKIKQALIYPSLMITISIGIVGFLLAYVVPKIVDVFSQTGQALPKLTVFLLNLSSGLQHYGLAILTVLVILFVLFKRALRGSRLRYQFDTFLLKIPLLKQFLRMTETARFLRTLGILQKAGVEILTALQSARAVLKLLPMQQRLKQAEQQVREGVALHRALQDTHDFPLMSLHLLHSGENSGQLDDMLIRAANNQEDEINQMINTGLSLFEPLLILIMGGVVLFIVLAVLLPIFSLDQIAGLS